MNAPITLTDLEQAGRAVRDGTINAAALRDLFEQAVAHQDDLFIAIDKTYTLADLKKRLAYPTGTKNRQAQQYFRALLDRLIVSDGYSYSFGESPYDGMRRALAVQTDEQLAAYAASRKQRAEALVKAVTDPVTLDEFKTFLAHRPESDLSDEQLALYDTLLADNVLRLAQEDAARRAVVARVEAPANLELLVKQDWHDRRQVAIWLVQPSRRVSADVFDDLSAKAKRFGGRWSSWGAPDKHGFVFFNQSDAEAFATITEADGDVIERWERRQAERQQLAADRLGGMAAQRQAEADEIAGADRLVNTARRARMAESALSAAEEQAQRAGILANVAEALAGGRLRYLARLRHATDVETLETVLVHAKYAAIRLQFPQGDPAIDWRRPFELSDIRQVIYPWPRYERRRLVALYAVAKRRRGLTRLMGYLQAEIGSKVSLHKGYEDEFVTVDGAAFEELIKILSALPDYDDGFDLRSRTLPAMRLYRMGISKLPHLRAALREYMPYRTERPVLRDRITLMEWDLAGRKIPGYFPTPPAVVERMLTAARLPEWTTCILEPSAGKGNIADAIRQAGAQHLVDCIEINTDLRRILEAKGHKLVAGDLLTYEIPSYADGTPTLDGYDRILMNPPFEDGQDMGHVRHAYSMLAPGGRLVAITSRHWTFAADRAATEFREWVDDLGGEWEDLPDGSFKSSERPTGVATTLLVLDR